MWGCDRVGSMGEGRCNAGGWVGGWRVRADPHPLATLHPPPSSATACLPVSRQRPSACTRREYPPSIVSSHEPNRLVHDLSIEQVFTSFTLLLLLQLQYSITISTGRLTAVLDSVTTLVLHKTGLLLDTYAFTVGEILCSSEHSNKSL